MGRLPSHWAQRKITYRIPYAMYGRVILTDAAAGANPAGISFPDPAFRHNVDKPFEIHRAIPRAFRVNGDNLYTGASGNGITDQFLISLRIKEMTRDQDLTSGPSPAVQLPMINVIKGDEEDTWEWAEPFVIERAGGFFVTAEIANTGGGALSSSVQLAFEGFLLIVAPATDFRG